MRIEYGSRLGGLRPRLRPARETAPNAPPPGAVQLRPLRALARRRELSIDGRHVVGGDVGTRRRESILRKRASSARPARRARALRSSWQARSPTRSRRRWRPRRSARAGDRRRRRSLRTATRRVSSGGRRAETRRRAHSAAIPPAPAQRFAIRLGRLAVFSLAVEPVRARERVLRAVLLRLARLRGRRRKDLVELADRRAADPSETHGLGRRIEDEEGRPRFDGIASSGTERCPSFPCQSRARRTVRRAA